MDLAIADLPDCQNRSRKVMRYLDTSGGAAVQAFFYLLYGIKNTRHFDEPR